MPAGSEGGIRPQRAEFAREATTGEFVSNPTYLLYSDNITGLSWSPSAGIAARRGIGDPDVAEHFNGPEEHEVTVGYDLQKFPVDGSGNPDDATGDGIVRTADNELVNTHNINVRERNDAIPAEETWNGANTHDTRLFLAGRGGYVSDVTFTGDPGSDQPVTVELTYSFEKVREYQVDQFTSASNGEVGVVSTDSGDTSQTLTVESEGAATTEDIALNGTTIVWSSSSFNDLDALHLDAETAGDVEVYQNEGTTASPTQGDLLATIRGSSFYGHGEGDLGVPALGTGSHASAIGTSYETILGDTIERPENTGLALEINSVEFSVSNDLDSREQVERPVMSMDAGDRNVEATATIVGATESVHSAEQHLGNRGNAFLWYLDGGLLQADAARLTDFGGVDKSSGEAAMSLDNSFEGQGVTVTSGASP